MADKPRPTIKTMKPGDLYTAPPSSWTTESVRKAIQEDPISTLRPGDTVHQRDDEGVSYAKGGAVTRKRKNYLKR